MNQSDHCDIALVTARDLPHPDSESRLLAEEIGELGLRADILPWDADVDWARIPLVVIRTAWDYFKRLSEFLAWARQVDELTLLVNPCRVIEWNAHKGYLLELSQKGVPIVPTILLTEGSGEESKAVLRNTAWVESVIKPAISASATGALRGETMARTSLQHLQALLSTGDALVQPLVADVLKTGEVSMMYFGGEFSHAVRKQAKPGEYRVQGEYGGTIHQHLPSSGELNIAAAALSAIPGEVVYARVDLVNLDARPVVMELELIEPELFLPFSPEGTQFFARKLCNLVGGKK
jgi:hypothetical protein